MAPGKSLRFQNATTSASALAISTPLFSVRSIARTLTRARRRDAERRHETERCQVLAADGGGYRTTTSRSPTRERRTRPSDHCATKQ